MTLCFDRVSYAPLRDVSLRFAGGVIAGLAGPDDAGARELLRLAAERATPIHIAPDMPAGEAFRPIALTCVRQIAANEPAVSAGKAEALHQMRIGLRRLRAAIRSGSVFRPG